jgi:hypothetical protein
MLGSAKLSTDELCHASSHWDSFYLWFKEVLNGAKCMLLTGVVIDYDVYV